DGTVSPATDQDGWFGTGDIGEVDENGLLRITDRKKELIITSGGKNVAPTKVEGVLRGHPLIGQVAVIGDGRPCITALLSLDEDAAPAWAKANGLDTVDLAELAEHPRVRAALDAAVEQANNDLARAEQVKRYHVLAKPWTAESGELTPTLKLRRRIISERYADEIERLYQRQD
ncbi:MAG: long-chain fatty acid--CoA ligase, partial [Sciscionella sp.]